MACSHWLVVLLGMLMMSSTRGQSTCSHGEVTNQPEVMAAKDTTMPWGTLYLSNCSVPQPPSGVGYLGRGFDVYHGNLLSTNGDIGFRLPVVHLSYQRQTMTSDRRYLLPDDTDLLHVTTSRIDDVTRTDVTEVRTQADVLRMINKRIMIQSSDLQDGRFKASSDYTDFRSAESTTLYQILEVPQYSLSFVNRNQVATKFFQDAVTLLPPTCRNEDLPHYVNLLRKYGTHVVRYVVLGKMAVRHVTLPTEDVMRKRMQGQSLQNIFDSTLNISSRNNNPAQSTTAPLKVRLEPMENFFTQRFLGRDTPALASKRQCLTRAASVYCRSLTTAPCNLQPTNMSNAIRYGDNITLAVANDGSLFLDTNISAIGTGTGFRLLGGKSGLTSQKKQFQILPSRVQEHRMGEFIFTGDVFTLSPDQVAGSRVQFAWTKALDPSQDSLTSSILYFQHVSQSLGQKDESQLFVKENKGQLYMLTLTTGGNHQTVTEGGPWSLTVETDHSLVSVVIDPCRPLCHPGEVVRAPVIIPAAAGGIRKVQLATKPSLLVDWPIRSDNWTLETLELTNMVSLTTYTTASSMTLAYTCGPCPTGRWSVDNGTLLVSKHNGSDVTLSVDAEFYFRLQDTSQGVVDTSSVVQLGLRGNSPGYNTTHPGYTLSCADRPCQNGGQCVPQGEGAVCECPSLWTGYTCDTACFAELFAADPHIISSLSSLPNIFGSSGRPNGTHLQWQFDWSPLPNPPPDFILITLPMVARVTALSAPSSLPIRQIDIEYFDMGKQTWTEGVILKLIPNSNDYYVVSVPRVLTTDRLKLIYRGRQATSLDLTNLFIYGCAMSSQSTMENYVDSLLSTPYTITRVTTSKTQSRNPSFNQQDISTDSFQSIWVTEQLQFRIPLNPSQTCTVDKRTVRWSIARQLDLCPSHIAVTNLSVTTDNPGGSVDDQRIAFINITLSGEQDAIHPARAKAIRLSNAGNLSLDCSIGSPNPGGSSGQSGDVVMDTSGLRDRIDTLERRTSILIGVVLFLLVVCFVVFVVFLVIMSRRYRDIRNELTTIRKLKMQKRIAKRQELQPQYTQQAFTLPRPNSVSSNTTTSIPGRSNGQTRPLRYSQSLHGLQDRPRLAAAAPAPGRGEGTPTSLDPSNYIIANPMRTPSPVGTKSGEESDTVQSVC